LYDEVKDSKMIYKKNRQAAEDHFYIFLSN